LISIIISMELALTFAFPTFCPYCPEDQVISPVTILVQDFVHTTLVLGMAVGIHIARRFLRNQAKIQQLETTSLKTELAFLKHQINPHFLFNSLNNIYVQNRKAPGDASESILLLSDLLRYQLYDCAKDKVYLKTEIEYLKNYLKLDKIRKSNAKLEFNVNGEANGMLVAPFLFIPFVENAVKHGMGLDNESFIRINFDIQPKRIKFSITNSKPTKPYPNVKGGIGLVNVRRRLKLLYPDRHHLKITSGKETYRVEMSLRVEEINENVLNTQI
ncbi:MAG: histidine kinase, partial [Bacteroidota bacterium]